MIIYNDIDPSAEEWLRQLIHLQAIPPGVVDSRSIKELTPDDVRHYTQAHFFCGIGGWPYAATLAGWPVDKPLWTGSCPCQPFSVAGKGAGFADERDLWPDFFRLIHGGRPPVVVGEQVAQRAGYGWLDRVRADLASEDYACRGVDIPACAVDAPHIRSRLYWVAVRSVEHAASLGRGEGRTQPEFWGGGPAFAGADAPSLAVGHPHGEGLERRHAVAELRRAQRQHGSGSAYADHEWLVCHDGKARRTKPGLPLLVDGVSGGVDVGRALGWPEAQGVRVISRVAAWRGFGNAIVPQLAAEVLKALL